jgi:hypothetical protein
VEFCIKRIVAFASSAGADFQSEAAVLNGMPRFVASDGPGCCRGCCEARNTVGVRGCFEKSRTAWRSWFADLGVAEKQRRESGNICSSVEMPGWADRRASRRRGRLRDFFPIARRFRIGHRGSFQSSPAVVRRLKQRRRRSASISEAKQAIPAALRRRSRKFVNFDELRPKMRRRLFGVFRSILSNSEATSVPGLIAPQGLLTKRFDFVQSLAPLVANEQR